VSGQSLEIVKGLIWRESYNPFVAVLSDITNMKKQQDIYKTERPDLYNCSLRECCKLLGNSLYGKTMERCALSKWHEFATLADYLAMTPIEQDKLVQPVHYCNNSLYVKTPEQRQKEAPLQFGVFVLAHTRDLMQRYFDIIGRENIIATETDSIYCSQKSLQPLLVSQDPLFCIGTDLGQMVIEMDNITEAFFLGKKCYSVRIGKNKYKHRLKGVPGKFLNWSAYRRLFLQWEVTFPYVCDSPDGESSTEPQGDDAMVQFQRNLFSAASSGVKLKKLWKTVVAQQDYKIYDHCNGCLKLVSIDQCPLAEHAQLTAKGNDLQQPPPAKKQKRARPSRSFAEMLIFSDAGKPLPHQATQQRLYDYLRTNKIVS
jgi:hypothetical protein